MEFGLSQEQVLLQDSINRFLTDEAPLEVVRQIAAGRASAVKVASEAVTAGSDDSVKPNTAKDLAAAASKSAKKEAELWQGLTGLGLAGLLTTEDNGGLGLGPLDAALVAECLGYHVTPSPYISSGVLAPATLQLARHREDLLSSLAAGEIRVGMALSEGLGARADAGHDVKVTVDPSKNGVAAKTAKLTGKSIFALDAAADYYLITTCSREIYLVDAAAKGLTRTSLQTIDNTRSTCELKFNKVEGQMIADSREVFDQIIDLAAVILAADTLGAAQCALDKAVAYAMQREQFNRVIASFQAVKHLCAEMASSLEPCRSMVWHAAYTLTEMPGEARMMASQTKAHLAEVGQFVTRTATEVHGGMGFTDLLGLHYWFKRAGFNRQMLGSPEFHRDRACKVQGLAP